MKYRRCVDCEQDEVLDEVAVSLSRVSIMRAFALGKSLRTWTASVMFVIFSLSSTIGQAPDWWGTRGVTVAGVAADDYAAINQGQLKHLARAAWLEMEANLTGGAGPVVTGMVTGWQTPTSATDDYAAVTAGQLKAVAKPFYDRLLETGALPAGSSYPWAAPGLVADDYAVVNAGQAKALFAFPIEAQDPWVKLTAPAPGRAILLGRTVKLTASAGSPEGIVKVQFYAGATMINHDLTAPYELTWVPTIAGDYVLSAKAVDGLGAVLESATVAFTVHADTDNDGMGDVWEVANGLTSTDEPLGDKDGDRVPNSWEYARGTAANAAVAAVYDAVVDAGKPTQAAIRRYRTLQEAYDSLPADPDYRSVVEVRRGTYEADLDAVTVRKKVAWIGQGFERSRGYGAALWVWTNSNCGIKVADETVFDRIIIDGGATVTGKETRPRPALVIKPATGVPKVGLINCVVRHWHTRDTTAGVTGYDPPSTGSILVLGGNLRLYHTTLYYSVGRNLGDTGWGNVIDNRVGSLLGGRNNIIWGFLDVSPAPVAVRDNFGVAASFGGNWTTIQGYSFSPLPNADPKLTAAGYLQHTLDGAGLLNPQLSSTVVIGQGTAVTGVLYDVRGQSRPAVSRDQGADEWGDADLDHLPDWWENYWFGGTTAQTRTGDPDGDGVNNLAEYHALSVPAALSNPNNPYARDSDGDGFSDDVELDHGTNPWSAESHPPLPPVPTVPGQDPALADADSDMLPDAWEVSYGFNPNSPAGTEETFVDLDLDDLTNIREWQLETSPILADTDADGMPDGWEVKYEFNPLSAADGAPDQDADTDTLSNLREYQLGTNPREKDSDGDGMPDDWELTQGLNPMSFEDGFSDADGDGYDARAEYANGTSLATVNPGGPVAPPAGPPVKGPALGSPGAPAVPGATPIPPTGRIVAYSRTRSAKVKGASQGIRHVVPDPPNRNSVVYLKKEATGTADIVYYNNVPRDESYTWNHQFGDRISSREVTDVAEEIETYDLRHTNKRIWLSAFPFLLTPDTVPPQPVPVANESYEEALDEKHSFNYSSLFTSTGNYDSPRRHEIDTKQRIGASSRSKTASGRFKLAYIPGIGENEPKISLIGRWIEEGGSHTHSTTYRSWESIYGWQTEQNEWDSEDPVFAIDVEWTGRTTQPSSFLDPTVISQIDTATVSETVQHITKNGKKIGTSTSRTELTMPLPWTAVDQRMRQHMVAQTFPAWSDPVKVTRNDSGIGMIGEATYDCAYHPGHFYSKSEELSWYLEYEVPEGTTAEERQLMEPISKPIWKLFKDRDGKLVGVQESKVTLEPGDTSDVYITVATNQDQLPDGGTVEVSFDRVELIPAEEIVVPADVAEVPISVLLDLPEPFSEAEVQWTIEEGEGGELEELVTKTAFGFATTVLKTNREVGTTYRVGVKVLKVFEIKEDEAEITHVLSGTTISKKTASIVVGPGPTAAIALNTGGVETLPADGRSEITVTASFNDAYGNPLALGSKVYWHLQGSGEILQQEGETREGEGGASVATAVLKAGAIPGLVQKLVIETDLSRKELLVPNTPLVFELGATPQWNTVDGLTNCTVTLTANVNAKDGTPIRWAATRGQMAGASSTVTGGQAQATVQISGNDSNYGLAVFTAAVGRSIAKASVALQNGGAHFDEPQLASPGPASAASGIPSQTTLHVHMPQWAGQSVRVSPESITSLEDQQPTAAMLQFQDGSSAAQDLVLDAEGRAQILVQAPEGLAASGMGEVRINHLLSSGGVNAAVPPMRAGLPVQALGADGAFAAGGAAAQAIVGLLGTVAPSDGALTAEEIAELERALLGAFQQSKSNGFVSGLLEIFPLEAGGGLQNQAEHANWRLRLAEFLDAQTGIIRKAAEEADKIHMEDAEGIQIVLDPGTGQMELDNGNGLLMEVDFGAEVMDTIRATGGNAGWVTNLEKAIHYAQSLLSLKGRGDAKLEAFIKAHASSEMFEKCKELVKRFGPKVVSHGDFDKAVEYFMPEGTARLLRSLEEFTRTVQANQTVFAGLVFEDMASNLIKPRLNDWANGMGSGAAKFAAGRAVSNVGYYYQLFTTAGSLAAMAGDAMEGNADKVIKRAAGHLVGLAMSAALGSEEARTELGKMCPGYSWYLLGLEQTEQWEQGDFFEAGRTRFDFELNAVGDMTIAIPLAKGAAAVLRIAGQGGRRALVQATVRSAEQTIIKKTFATPVLALPKKPAMPPPVKQGRFAGVTYQRHLNGLSGETKFAHYLHYQTDEIVILWGDGVGTHGADIITVNAKTGRVTLWDTKWRTNPTLIGPSKTFTKAETLENAIQQAREALNETTHLPPSLKQTAVEEMRNGVFNTRTPGVGPGARSSGIGH